MKKTLEYVSDYQLESACKYALCIAHVELPEVSCCVSGLISSPRPYTKF